MGYKQRLSSAEKRLLGCVESGEPFDLRTGSESDDVSHAMTWPKERCVRAEVLASLLLRMGSPMSSNLSVLSLSGARITGRMTLTGASIPVTLVIEECYFDEAPDLADARTRSLYIRRSHLPGIYARHAYVDGRLDFSGTTSTGRVHLVNAHIADELIMNGSEFQNPDGWTLFAGGVTVDGAVFGINGFKARGGIRLVGARLNGGVFLSYARLAATADAALVGDNLQVQGRMVCDGLVADGGIRLPGAQINGQLTLDHAVIQSESIGLDFRRLVAEDLVLTPAERIRGIVDLTGSRVSVFCDSRDSWPYDIRLDGFTYDSLIARRAGTGADGTILEHVPDPSDASPVILPARERLSWLRRTSAGYRPQPYEQLAFFYRKIGHDDEARKVLLAKQRQRRSTQGPTGRAWSYLLDWSVGYGYRPWLAALWLAILIIAGTVVFALRPPPAVSPSATPQFDPFVYTVNLLLPIGQFIQSGQWTLIGAERWFAYGLVGAGWLLATTVIAGITRILNRS